MGIELKIYNSFEEITGFQAEWDNFVEANGADIFMTFDWCRIWWKYYGKNRDLRIFIFHSNDDLVGIVPLFFEKIWLGLFYIRVVKIVGADFTLAQFSLPIQDGFLKEVALGLSEKLHVLEWDIIHVGPIAGICNSFPKFKKALRGSFSSFAEVRSEEKGVQTYFELDENFEEQISNLGKSERKRLRRIQRFIDKKELSLKLSYAIASNLKDYFTSFKETHKDYWQKRNQGGHFCDWPDSELFHQDMALSQLKKNRLRLLELSYEDKRFGFKYAYKFGGKYFAILSARSGMAVSNKMDFGRLSYIVQSNEARLEGISLIDSMRGKYEYKNKMGGKLYPIQSIYVIRKGWLRVIRVQLFRILSKLYNIGYYKIWFCRVAPKMLKKNRPLNRLWIKTQGFS